MEAILKEIFTSDYAICHHAFLLAGEPTTLISSLREELIEKVKIPRSEISEVLKSKLTIDYSRELKAVVGAPLSHQYRFLLVGFTELTTEAEQALLKLLEEPPTGLIIILICPQPASLRPTILSRVWQIGRGEGGVAKFKFLGLTPASRLALITKELDKLAEEEVSAKTYVLSVLSTVEQELAALILVGVGGQVAKDAGESIKHSRKLVMTGNRFSAKLFLEHLSLTLPRL